MPQNPYIENELPSPKTLGEDAVAAEQKHQPHAVSQRRYEHGQRHDDGDGALEANTRATQHP